MRRQRTQQSDTMDFSVKAGEEEASMKNHVGSCSDGKRKNLRKHLSQMFCAKFHRAHNFPTFSGGSKASYDNKSALTGGKCVCDMWEASSLIDF